MRPSFAPRTFRTPELNVAISEEVTILNGASRALAGISGFVSLLGAGAFISSLHAPTELMAEVDAGVGAFCGLGGLVLGGIALAARLKARNAYRQG